jgi:hypothetical protein
MSRLSSFAYVFKATFMCQKSSKLNEMQRVAVGIKNVTQQTELRGKRKGGHQVILTRLFNFRRSLYEVKFIFLHTNTSNFVIRTEFYSGKDRQQDIIIPHGDLSLSKSNKRICS